MKIRLSDLLHSLKSTVYVYKCNKWITKLITFGGQRLFLAGPRLPGSPCCAVTPAKCARSRLLHRLEARPLSQLSTPKLLLLKQVATTLHHPRQSLSQSDKDSTLKSKAYTDLTKVEFWWARSQVFPASDAVSRALSLAWKIDGCAIGVRFFSMRSTRGTG